MVLVPAWSASAFPDRWPGDCLPCGAEHYQQLYLASEFSAPLTIAAIILQSSSKRTPTQLFRNISIGLSTTSVGPDGLSQFFQSNRGLDFTVVYNGELTLSSPRSTDAPIPFEIAIPLKTPFAYDPSQGDLLLEWQYFRSGSQTSVDLDATGTTLNGPATFLWSHDNLFRAGWRSTNGFVTQFVPVPEPSTGFLVALGLAAIAVRRRTV